MINPFEKRKIRNKNFEFKGVCSYCCDDIVNNDFIVEADNKKVHVDCKKCRDSKVCVVCGCENPIRKYWNRCQSCWDKISSGEFDE